MKNAILTKQELRNRGAIEDGKYMILEHKNYIHFYRQEGRDYYVHECAYDISHKKAKSSDAPFSNVVLFENAMKTLEAKAK